jgi:hypothetical protein
MADVMEIDAQTNEVIVRDMTAGEVEQRTKDLAKHAALSDAQAEAKASRALAREALLDRLGITVEEAQLLLGGI